MTSRVSTDKPDVTFRRKHSTPDGVLSGTTMAGAITGGTIGAFAGGPVGSVAGLAIGAVAALFITRYAHDDLKAPKNGDASAD